jgi:hypothetical protein
MLIKSKPYMRLRAVHFNELNGQPLHINEISNMRTKISFHRNENKYIKSLFGEKNCGHADVY